MKTLYGLYAITDSKLIPEQEFENRVEAVLKSGARILQYRDKSTDHTKRLQQANSLRELCNSHNALLIINDDIELARNSCADGIHIGKDDDSLEQARQQLGKDKIIGVSCYNQLELAHKAIRAGADYIAFGSFFSSSIKPDAPTASIDLIQEIKQEYSIPVCCIGGITQQNHQPLLDAGADMLAVISELFAHDNLSDIEQAAQDFSHSFRT